MQRIDSFPYLDLLAMDKLGAFFWLKAKLQQLDHGTYQAARNLRKQGVPLDLALLVLTGRNEDRLLIPRKSKSSTDGQ